MQNLKIAFVYGPMSLGSRPIDFPNVWSSPRGLTGSELSCICLSKEMAKMGHSVSFFIPGPNAVEFDGIPLRDYVNLSSESGGYDAVCSWNEPDALRGVNPKAVRLVNQQLNDFGYCQSGFDDFVDLYTSPSQSHMDFIRGQTPSPHKWSVLPNGCDPSQYGSSKVPGRVIYASSPDRGLHLLLQAWPAIKKAVPHAHLRVFYNMDSWLSMFMPVEHHNIPDFVELGRRARYVHLALKRMAGLDIAKVGSVSRAQMVREMSEATVLAYPCDTVRFTEGFSVTTMEACAAGVVPVISTVDSLGQIYQPCVPAVQSPARDHIPEFAEFVVRGLTDASFQTEVREKALILANSHRWSVLAGRLEALLLEKIKK